MQKQFVRFIVRWLVNSLGLWIAARLLDSITYEDSWAVIIGAGLVLSLVNAMIKPLVVILALPAILFSLGLFMLFINGLMVFLVANFVSGLEVESFGSAILAGIIIGLVNYAVTTVFEEKGNG